MNYKELRHHVGRFKISRSLFETEPYLIMSLMGEMIITRAEFNFASNSFEYEAICPQFRHIPDSQVIPLYTVIFSQYGGFEFNEEKQFDKHIKLE